MHLLMNLKIWKKRLQEIRNEECMHFEYTKDVMDMMTEFRKAWKFTYPEEE